MGFDVWEPVTRWFFFLAAREARSVVDVGAYSGVYALTAAKANPRAVVTAVEPNPLLAELARQNIDENGVANQVNLCQVAASDVEGIALLHTSERSGESSKGSLVFEADGPSMTVTTKRLDDLIPQPGPDLIKIDVEGFEVEVLRGASQSLARSHPVIVTEALSDVELRRQSEVLEEFGYTGPIRVCGEGSDRRNYVWSCANDRLGVLEKLNVALTKTRNTRRG
jgi:FkbM family methyltransferase